MTPWSAWSAAIPERTASTSWCWTTATSSIKSAYLLFNCGMIPSLSSGCCAVGAQSTWSPLPQVMDSPWSEVNRFPTTTSTRCRWSGLINVAGMRGLSDSEPGFGPFSARVLPVVFLPGGLHLPTIPSHRKVNTVDLGTADKVAVAALALWFDAIASGGFDRSTFAVVEIGSAFSAILVVERGRVVDASAGTRGPIGLLSRGCWDGEVAYWLGPLTKDDLFQGGLATWGQSAQTLFANR